MNDLAEFAAVAEPEGPPAPTTECSKLGLSATHLLAWGWVVLLNAVWIQIEFYGVGTIETIALHHLYDAGQVLAIGLVVYALEASWPQLERRFGVPEWVHYAGLMVGGWAIAIFTFDDVHGFINRQLPSPRAFYWFPLLTMLGGLSFVTALLLGRLLNRAYVRWLAAAVCTAVLLLNQAVLAREYAGPHLFATASSALLLGTAFSGVAVAAPKALRAERVLRRLLPILVAVAIFTIWTPPKPTVGMRLFRTPGAVLAPFLAEARGVPNRRLTAPIDESKRSWLEPRTGRKPISAGPPLVARDQLIVILLTVDALRADLIGDERYTSVLPGIEAMRRASVQFTDARSVAPATQQSLSALATGLYPAQLAERTRRIGGRAFKSYDDTPYLALPGTDVETVHVYTNVGVRRAYVLGFDTVLPRKRSTWGTIHDVLRKYEGGPLFIYAHFMEPHRPYGSASDEHLPAFERYVRDVALVDKQLRKLRTHLQKAGLRDRTILILSADHGEAFGEHGLNYHSKTLYDEMLRIPLLIEAPGVAPRKVTTPVSLIDLTPTILDLFGQPTPGKLMGASLLGFLRGETPALDRPIVMQRSDELYALVFPDGFKVIYDQRRQVAELYDLQRDPGERENLLEDPATSSHLGTLLEFFEVHSHPQQPFGMPRSRR